MKDRDELDRVSEHEIGATFGTGEQMPADLSGGMRSGWPRPCVVKAVVSFTMNRSHPITGIPLII